MSDKQKRWFTSNYTTRIALQNVGNQEIRGYGKFFDSWHDAHADLLQRTEKELDAAKRELKAVERRYQKVTRMTPTLPL